MKIKIHRLSHSCRAGAAGMSGLRPRFARLLLTLDADNAGQLDLE
jgi:hypothetical protein